MDARSKSTSNKSNKFKALKVEIKQWRKELGKERKQKSELENALSDLEVKINDSKELENVVVVEEKPVPALTEPYVPNETVEEIIECSICAEVIYKFAPTYFIGVEMNPAWDGCKDPAVETESQSEENSNNAATNRDTADENDY